MLRSKEPVHPRLLAKAFKQICEENHTGVLQIITKKVQVVSFDIKDGKISSIKYKTRRNKEALQEIGAIEESKYTFYERKEVGEINVDIEMPTNEEVLQYLLGEPTDVLSTPTSPTAPKETNKKENNQQQSSDNKEDDTQQIISLELKEGLKKALTEQIGPISSIMCKDVFSKTVYIDTAIKMLADKIPDAGRAQSFRAEAEYLLNSSLKTDEGNSSKIGELHKRLEEYLKAKLPSGKASDFIAQIRACSSETELKEKVKTISKKITLIINPSVGKGLLSVLDS